MWGALIDYYHFTNDDSYNPTVEQALLSQVGPLYDYMVPNRQKEEGNDDQAFWGFATMSAAEYDFSPPSAPVPSWLTLTENLWNTQAARWDTSTCGGGLKWQIFSFNNGYNYKNSVSNGAFFLLSARLARYTGNSTYLDWADKVWDWSEAVGLVDGDYQIYDGADDTQNCTEISKLQWSYAVGIYTYGASILYNISTTQATSSSWQTRTKGIIDNNVNIFFSPYSNATDIMFEQACEFISTCNYDQRSFKAYLSRFWWATTRMAPFTYSTIYPLLSASASAAAASCSGPSNVCGSKWYTDGYDGVTGPGQQLSALETIVGLLGSQSSPPSTDGHAVESPAVSSSSSAVQKTTSSTKATVVTEQTPSSSVSSAPEMTSIQTASSSTSSMTATSTTSTPVVVTNTSSSSRLATSIKTTSQSMSSSIATQTTSPVTSIAVASTATGVTSGVSSSPSVAAAVGRATPLPGLSLAAAVGVVVGVAGGFRQLG